MEVYLVGPTISIEVSTPPAHVRDCKGGEPPTTTAANGGRNPCTCTCSFPSLLMSDGEREKSEFQPAVSPDRDISETESSSSIGSPTDDEEEGDESEEVQSKFVGSLSSLNSLEESLPIKRGLSNHFTGKSKSFANLADASSAKDLEKQESPFNKRRRTLIQYKLGRKSCFYSWSDPKSMPLLALREEEDEDEDEDEEEGKREEIRRSKVNEIGRRKLRSFKSSGRSFLSLTDLQG